MSKGQEIKDRLSSGGVPRICLAADVDNVVELYGLLAKCKSRRGILKIDVLKIHPDIIHMWSDDIMIVLQYWAKKYGCLLWADLKICDVSHIMKAKLDVIKWVDIVTIMSNVAIPEILDEIQEDLREKELVAFVVPTLHTNGKKVWEDPNAGELAEILPNYPNIIGSVGLKIPGLLYIKAGVGADEDVEGVDLIVRGRSLMGKLL